MAVVLRKGMTQGNPFLGCTVKDAAAVAAAQRISVIAKRAPTNPSPGRIRPP
jgi:hypothetical protein